MGRHTNPVSSLGKYVLCGIFFGCTSGLVARLRAFQRFLEKFPKWREKVILLQVFALKSQRRCCNPQSISVSDLDPDSISSENPYPGGQKIPTEVGKS
jgi:hypothetical protein